MEESDRLMFDGWGKLPVFRRHVEQASTIIKEAINIDKAYVACSWGKDSTALLHLAQSVCAEIQVIHWKTPKQELLGDYERVSGEYLSRFPTTNYLEIEAPLETVIPKAVKLSKIWLQYPVGLIGVRAQENPKLRGASLKKYGAIHQYKQGNYRAWPIGRWSWRDSWAYIVQHDLPYLSSYDKVECGGRDRSRTTNVMPFLGGGSKSQRLGRIAEIRATSPDAFAFLKEFYPEIANSS